MSAIRKTIVSLIVFSPLRAATRPRKSLVSRGCVDEGAGLHAVVGGTVRSEDCGNDRPTGQRLHGFVRPTDDNELHIEPLLGEEPLFLAEHS
jgi:hypothetical protein